MEHFYLSWYNYSMWKFGKQAIALPLVLVLLVAMGLMAVAINYLAISGYKIGNRATDNLKAMLLCESLLAEAEAEIRHKLNNEYFDSIKGGGDDDLPLDCEDGPLTTMLRDDIVDISDTPGTVHAAPFNIDELHVEAKVWGSAPLAGEDKMRMITISATAGVNGFEKQIHATYDVKIADIRPVANKFGLHVESSGNNDFNNPGPGDGHLWIIADTDGCEGVSIGGSTTINTHSKYNTHPHWSQDNRTRDLVKGGQKNSDRSLVPHDNEPWADAENGNLMALAGMANGRGMQMLNDGQGMDWEDMKSCPDSTEWEDPGPHPFNSGYNPAPTHLFGKHVEHPTTVHGNVKKKWNKWEYEFNDSITIPDPMCIPGCQAGVSEGCCMEIDTPYGPIYICTHSGERCNMTNDWNMMDKWNVKNKGTATDDYKCDGSSMSSFKALSEDMNAKGSTVNMNTFKKSATRVKTTLDENDNTLVSSTRYYPEGIFFAENNGKFRSNCVIRTPGMIVVGNGTVNMNSKISLGATLNRPGGGTYFNNGPTLAVVGKKANLGGQQIQAGIRMENSITGSSVKIKGNLSVKNIKRNQFSGEIEYDPALSNKLTSSPTSLVVTMSPIVCSWVDTSNTK